MTPSQLLRRPGRICTFYSYKGGVGRSMALANIAALLHKSGRRVLVIDWDLEAPGLERYFHAKVNERGEPVVVRRDVTATPGVLDLLEAVKNRSPADWRACLVPIEFPWDSEGTLDLLPSGQRDELYNSRLHAVDFESLFETFDFGRILETWRQEWTASYDFVLIDSRTGITNASSICTIFLPDVLIGLFTANAQSIEGVASVLTSAVAKQNSLPVDRTRLLPLPILSRDESHNEHEQALFWRARVADIMRPFFREWVDRRLRIDDIVRKLYIPYFAYWSFGERLPVVEKSDEVHDPRSVGAAYARLASLIDSDLDWSVIDRQVTPEELEDARRDVERTRRHLQTASREARRWKRVVYAVCAAVLLALSAGAILTATWTEERHSAEFILAQASATTGGEMLRTLVLKELRGDEEPERGVERLRKILSDGIRLERVIREEEPITDACLFRDDLLVAHFADGTVRSLNLATGGSFVCLGEVATDLAGNVQGGCNAYSSVMFYDDLWSKQLVCALGSGRLHVFELDASSDVFRKVGDIEVADPVLDVSEDGSAIAVLDQGRLLVYETSEDGAFGEPTPLQMPTADREDWRRVDIDPHGEVVSVTPWPTTPTYSGNAPMSFALIAVGAQSPEGVLEGEYVGDSPRVVGAATVFIRQRAASSAGSYTLTSDVLQCVRGSWTTIISAGDYRTPTPAPTPPPEAGSGELAERALDAPSTVVAQDFVSLQRVWSLGDGDLLAQGARENEKAKLSIFHGTDRSWHDVVNDLQDASIYVDVTGSTLYLSFAARRIIEVWDLKAVQMRRTFATTSESRLPTLDYGLPMASYGRYSYPIYSMDGSVRYYSTSQDEIFRRRGAVCVYGGLLVDFEEQVPIARLPAAPENFSISPGGVRIAVRARGTDIAVFRLDQRWDDGWNSIVSQLQQIDGCLVVDERMVMFDESQPVATRRYSECAGERPVFRSIVPQVTYHTAATY